MCVTPDSRHLLHKMFQPATPALLFLISPHLIVFMIVKMHACPIYTIYLKLLN